MVLQGRVLDTIYVGDVISSLFEADNGLSFRVKRLNTDEGVIIPKGTSAQVAWRPNAVRVLNFLVVEENHMTLVLHAKRFFDGARLAPVEGATIVVEGHNIMKVGGYGSVEVPSGATVLDLSDHTLAPGSIDAHSHVTVETAAAAEEVPANDVELTLLSVSRLQKDLRSGVTTMRMMGDRRFTDLSFKNAQAAGFIDLPRLKVSGNLIKPSNVNVSVSEVIADGPDLIRKYLA